MPFPSHPREIGCEEVKRVEAAYNDGISVVVKAFGIQRYRYLLTKLSYFQQSAYFAGIKIFNSLPSSLTSLINKKARIKIVLKRYLITHCF
jgi:hypothetical protein